MKKEKEDLPHQYFLSYQNGVHKEIGAEKLCITETKQTDLQSEEVTFIVGTIKK